MKVWSALCSGAAGGRVRAASVRGGSAEGSGTPAVGGRGRAGGRAGRGGAGGRRTRPLLCGSEQAPRGAPFPQRAGSRPLRYGLRPSSWPGGGRACPSWRCRDAEYPPGLGVRGSLRPAAGTAMARGVPVGAVIVPWAAGFHRRGLRAREAGAGGRWASLPGPSGPQLGMLGPSFPRLFDFGGGGVFAAVLLETCVLPTAFPLVVEGKVTKAIVTSLVLQVTFVIKMVVVSMPLPLWGRGCLVSVIDLTTA